MNVAIIGSGYVGLTTGVCLASLNHQVICVDRDEKKIQQLQAGECPIFEPGLNELIEQGLRSNHLRFTTDLKAAVEASEMVFICVNTPPKPDGQADLRFIEAVAREISQHLNTYKVIVDKSTVPVKTAERVKETILKYSQRTADFDVVSNPEFLREGSAIEDTLKPDRLVIGVESARAKTMMLELYRPIIEGVKMPVMITSVRSAELIKHGANTFLASKISFANMIAAVCDEIGADAREVLEAIGLDARIGKEFLRPGIGFGGSCFPKDLSAFKKTLELLGLDNGFVKAVEDLNEQALVRFMKLVEKELWVIDKKRITILGLAFKPNTDDIRNAQSIKIIEWLKNDGADLVVHDPHAMKKVQALYPDIEYAKTALAALEKSEAVIICTEWNEYKNLDLTKMKDVMSTPVIFDGRNIFDGTAAKAAGFRYFGVGRGKRV